MSKSFELTSAEAQRYSRHLVLPEIGPLGQRRLKNSSMLVVGMGGLGIPAAVYLGSAGVGKVGLVDCDAVEMSNLQRQFLFSESDIGSRKVDVVKERLHQANPNVEITTYDLRLDSGNALEILGRYDVVIDATDNLPSRYLISDACVLLGKPDVYASALGFEGQASVFYPPHGPCYRCLYPEPPPPEFAKSCEDAGVLGVVPGIMGGLQANQAIGIILGKGSPLVGRLLVFDGLYSTFDEVRVKKNGSCPACGPNPKITELVDYDEFCGLKPKPKTVGFDVTVHELKSSIDEGRPMVLLDVREPYEHALCHLPGAKLIPLGELSGRMNELAKGSEIVVYCHVGVRSTSAVALLRRAGFANARNLKGGIDAWAATVDQEMSRY